MSKQRSPATQCGAFWPCVVLASACTGAASFFTLRSAALKAPPVVSEGFTSRQDPAKGSGVTRRRGGSTGNTHTDVAVWRVAANTHTLAQKTTRHAPRTLGEVPQSGEAPLPCRARKHAARTAWVLLR